MSDWTYGPLHEKEPIPHTAWVTETRQPRDLWSLTNTTCLKANKTPKATTTKTNALSSHHQRGDFLQEQMETDAEIHGQTLPKERI